MLSVHLSVICLDRICTAFNYGINVISYLTDYILILSTVGMGRFEVFKIGKLS